MSNFKPPVLCVTRDLLPLPQRGFGIYPLDLKSIPQKAFHYINRDVVDGSHSELFSIGRALPQLLAYVVIKCGSEYLTYSRKKGAETRLHGSRSIGFGGHVDVTDLFNIGEVDNYFIQTLFIATLREITEELNYEISEEEFKKLSYDSVLLDTTNPVGCVHLGIPLVLEISNKDLVKPDPSEISDPVWETVEKLQETINQYENWSQLLIKR